MLQEAEECQRPVKNRFIVAAMSRFRRLSVGAAVDVGRLRALRPNICVMPRSDVRGAWVEFPASLLGEISSLVSHSFRCA